MAKRFEDFAAAWRVGKRRMPLVVWLAFFGIVLAVSETDTSAAEQFGEQELKSVLAALAQNEALLANVEVRWHGEYLGGQSGTDVRPNEIVNRKDSGHFVQQGSLFFVEHRGLQSSGERHGIPLFRVKAYDGEQTVGMEKRGSLIANISRGIELDSYIFQPHLLPLRRQGVLVPLSTYLKGSEAIRRHPRGRDDELASENMRLTGSWHGTEEIDGLCCHRVEVLYEMRESSAQPFIASNRRVFWLAIDRNYLPIRAVSYRLGLSETIPIEETCINELQELQPDVWYPRIATYKVHDFDSIQHTGQAVVRAEERWTIDSVCLNPNHDLAFFRSIDIPDDTPIYEIEKGEIVRSSIQGREIPGTGSSPRRNWHFVVIAINAALLGGVASLLFIRWWKRKTPAR